MPPILPEIYLQASLAVSGPNIFCGGSLLTDRYIYSRGFWGFPLPNLHRQSCYCIKFTKLYLRRHVLTAGHCVEGVDSSTLQLVEVLFK